MVEIRLTEYDSLSDADHPSAPQGPWAMGSLPSGVEYGEGRLFVAAVVIAAELRVTRFYEGDWDAKHIGSLLLAADAQLVGDWRGSSL